MKKKLVLSACFSISIFLFGACAAERGPSGAASVVGASVKSVYSARLTWEAPTTNTDGSPLKDLAGYNVYYRLPSQDYHKDRMKHLPLKNEEGDDEELNEKVHCEKTESGIKGNKARTVCTYTVRDLEGGAYYFAVRAYNLQGQESDFSNEVKK